MNIRKLAAFGLFSTVALLPLLYAQTGGNDSATVAAITKLENDGVKADLANDKSFMQNNTTDDFIGGTSYGTWETKASSLKDMDDPANNKMKSESISDMKVATSGNVAIARYSVTYDSLRHGKPLARTVLCTDTWIKQGDSWKEAASHCSEKGKE